ncbi:hypothetical protein [Kiloniella litopenaei]|nr:hypothetical protein [Kiloniella litopenaei]
MKIIISKSIKRKADSSYKEDLRQLIKLIAVAAARADFAAEKGGANDN